MDGNENQHEKPTNNLINTLLEHRYLILEEIGKGGMATVYKAKDTDWNKIVAVKIIRIERLAPEILNKALKRFEQEAISLADLSHKNVIKVIDYGQHENSPFLVMDYFSKGALKKMIGNPHPWQDAIRMLKPVAEALEYAHQQDIIHRDVKPSNILFNENDQLILADFGIAKILDEEATVDLTGTKAVIGTPDYMSPEQGLGKPIDVRSDVYSLGIVLYELITGRNPFHADTPMETVFMHVSEPLPRPGKYVPKLPQEVEQMLIRALSKKPEDRYQTMAEFATELDKLASGQITPEKKKTTAMPQWVPWLAGAGLIILALIAFLPKGGSTPLPSISSPRSTSTPRKPTKIPAKYAYISVSNAYLYQGPDLEYYPARSDPYSKGSKFTVLARSTYSNWLLCRAQDGTVGWLYKDWIDISFSISNVSVAATIPVPPPPPTRRPSSGRN